MAYHHAVFLQETMEGYVHTQIRVFETDEEACAYADQLNNTGTPTEDYYYVRNVIDPDETLEDVDSLLGYDE